ncbi:MAG: CDP-diacylglycerol--glycerol-3-phosphate 3-phosphatidyltransferase [Bacillota bacterium]|nr:CDP-diacylglycerol--glycerol-3-phosphate 3-phosphatidyltransferase [Bacillota bacterium]
MTLATKITILRIAMIPVFIIVFYMQYAFPLFGYWNHIVALIFMAASITDALDGHYARKRREISEAGKLLDPVADKLLIAAAIILLVELGKVPAWIAIILIGREFIISAYRLVAVTKGNVIAAKALGKAKTITQIVAVIVLLVEDRPFPFLFVYDIGGYKLTLGSIILYLSVVLSIISLIEYMLINRHVLKKD